LKDNLAPIYCRVTVDSRRVEISLRQWIDPKDWNSVKSTARGSREEIKVLNHHLEEVKGRLMECYREMQIEKQLITAEAIKNEFLGNDQQGHTLSEVIDYHNTHIKDSLAWGTMKNYFTTQKYIQMFLNKK